MHERLILENTSLRGTTKDISVGQINRKLVSIVPNTNRIMTSAV